MRKPLFHPGRLHLVTSLVLVALLFRAYVPVGFMPASGTPFLLELCSATYPGPTSAHHAHHHLASHTHADTCPFGSAPAAGPLSHFLTVEPPASIVSRYVAAFDPLRTGVRFYRAHQPRAPPTFT